MANKFAVKLRVYDISKGLARSLSPLILGKTIDGIWHTGLQVYGQEYFFGGGILSMPPEELEREYEMTPVREVDVGETTMTKPEFERRLADMHPRFTEATYDLIKWNCNHFTDECAKVLVGHGIAHEYVHQHLELMDTPMGQQILGLLSSAQKSMQQHMSEANQTSLFTAGLNNPNAFNPSSAGNS